MDCGLLQYEVGVNGLWTTTVWSRGLMDCGLLQYGVGG